MSGRLEAKTLPRRHPARRPAAARRGPEATSQGKPGKPRPARLEPLGLCAARRKDGSAEEALALPKVELRAAPEPCGLRPGSTPKGIDMSRRAPGVPLAHWNLLFKSSRHGGPGAMRPCRGSRPRPAPRHQPRPQLATRRRALPLSREYVYHLERARLGSAGRGGVGLGRNRRRWPAAFLALA